MTKMIQQHIYLTEEQTNAINHFSKKTGVPRSAIIRFAISNYLDDCGYMGFKKNEMF